jgi:hypothetical protein
MACAQVHGGDDASSSLIGPRSIHRPQSRIPHSGGQHMLTYRADPDSDTAKALDALRSLS